MSNPKTWDTFDHCVICIDLIDYVSFIQLPDKGMGKETLMKEIDKYENLG